MWYFVNLVGFQALKFKSWPTSFNSLIENHIWLIELFFRHYSNKKREKRFPFSDSQFIFLHTTINPFLTGNRYDSFIIKGVVEHRSTSTFLWLTSYAYLQFLTIDGWFKVWRVLSTDIYRIYRINTLSHRESQSSVAKHLSLRVLFNGSRS